MQGYQSLEEAAQTLSMSAEELRQMAQRNQIRSFQDRGTLRFRIQDVQEMARQLGLTSNEMETGPRTPKASELGSGRMKKQEATDFSLDIGEDQLDIGADLAPPSAARSPSRNFGSQVHLDNRTDFSLEITEDEQVDIGLAPAASGSDSDVKLVAPQDSKVGKSSSSARWQAQPASGVAPPVTPPAKVKSSLGGGSKAQRKSALGSQRKSALGSQRKSALGAASDPLTAKASDSDVKIVGLGSVEANLGKAATDSEMPMFRPGSDEGMLFTEEINLEEEIRRQEAALHEAAAAEPSQAASPFEIPVPAQPQDRPASQSQLGNYSLEEAAQFLGMPVDELRQMAQRSQIRSFLHRRLDALSRARTFRSWPGNASAGSAAAQQGPRQPARLPCRRGGEGEGEGEEFDFSLEIGEDQLAIGGDLVPGGGSGARGSSKKLGSRAKPPGDSDFSLEINDDQVGIGQDIGSVPRSDRKPATPPPGSDSDVRLISDQDFSLGSDSDVKLAGQESSATRRKGRRPPRLPTSKNRPSPPAPSRPASIARPGSSSSKKKSALSGAPIIPSDSDSDVKIVGAGSGEGGMGRTFGATDSDIRLEGQSGNRRQRGQHAAHRGDQPRRGNPQAGRGAAEPARRQGPTQVEPGQVFGNDAGCAV